jgi:hypothetical protein
VHRHGGGVSSMVMAWEGDLAWWKKIKCRQKGGVGLGAPHGEEVGGGVRHNVAAVAGPEPVGARCVGSRPKQGTQGWLPGGS